MERYKNSGRSNINEVFISKYSKDKTEFLLGSFNI